LGALAFGGAKIAFLVVIWLFIALVTVVIRTDLFARRTPDGAPDRTQHLEHAGQPNPKRRGRPANTAGVLKVVAGPGAGDAVPLVGEITLGRAADSTLDLTDDFASSHHARLYADEKGWIVQDLNSTNGTYINGVRIVRATRVGPEDIIRIGRTQLRLER
jgi:pSer/pThr/pTyr-binding forkhead associated (FHA) protein